MTILDLELFIRKILTKTTATSFLAADILLLENKYYEDVVAELIKESAASKWPFGDSNYTGFPTYTFNLIAGTRVYDIDTSVTGALVILGVEIQNASGDYYVISPISLSNIHNTGISQSEFLETSGSPLYYEKRENQIVLYPAPATANVTLTAGCRIFFLRTADTFTAAQQTAGTKEPGFPSPYHDAIGYGVASDYWSDKDLERASYYERKYQRRIKSLLDFISRRDQDVKKAMQNRITKYV